MRLRVPGAESDIVFNGRHHDLPPTFLWPHPLMAHGQDVQDVKAALTLLDAELVRSSPLPPPPIEYRLLGVDFDYQLREFVAFYGEPADVTPA